MVEPEDNIAGLGGRSERESAQSSDELPYYVELWHSEMDKVERVLARAVSIQLARAIFTSAQTEFPGRRITLRRDSDIVLDTQQ